MTWPTALDSGGRTSFHMLLWAHLSCTTGLIQTLRGALHYYCWIASRTRSSRAPSSSVLCFMSLLWSWRLRRSRTCNSWSCILSSYKDRHQEEERGDASLDQCLCVSGWSRVSKSTTPISLWDPWGSCALPAVSLATVVMPWNSDSALVTAIGACPPQTASNTAPLNIISTHVTDFRLRMSLRDLRPLRSTLWLCVAVGLVEPLVGMSPSFFLYNSGACSAFQWAVTFPSPILKPLFYKLHLSWPMCSIRIIKQRYHLVTSTIITSSILAWPKCSLVIG